jgi:hypothetical protein
VWWGILNYYILYILYIIYYTYTIISYLILYSSSSSPNLSLPSLFFCSLLFLYNPLLFFHFSPFPLQFYSLPSYSLLISFILYLSVLGYTYLYSKLTSSPILPILLFQSFSTSPLLSLFFPIFQYSSFSLFSSQYSFYTCRYLHILIYIIYYPLPFSHPNPSQTRYPSLKGIHIYLLVKGIYLSIFRLKGIYL